MWPLLLIGAGISILIGLKGFGFNGKNIRLAVLGPSNSGKTVLLKYLEKGYIQTTTRSTPVQGEKINKVKITNGKKTITLESTWDVNGFDDVIKRNYPKLISDSTHILFIFNTKEFLEDENFRNRTLEMIAFINDKNTEKKVMLFFGTHIDVLLGKDDSKNKRKEISEEILKHLYKELDLTHINEITLVNFLNIKEMEAIKKALFK